MPREATLARARAELASGSIASITMATQRLRGLVGSFPLDLEMRAQLAEAYRRQGNLVQAGRWSYLSEHRDAAEAAAFERATPDPLERMRALAWPADEDAASTTTAAGRLGSLRTAAEARHNRTISYPELRPERATAGSGEDVWSWREAIGCALVCVLVALVVGLFLLGTAHGVWIAARWLF